MLDFFLAELRRFRIGAAVYCLANLAGLAMLQQIVDLPNGAVGLHVIMAGFYMLSGLALAVFQFGSYRRPARWIWLQHRPVHRARILAALVLAATLLIAVAVALPLVALLLALRHYTHNVVDARHFAGAAYLALSALAAWLAGGYTVLHRSRWAFIVLVLPVVLTMRLATAATVLGLTAACALVLLGLLYTVFRPNRSAADDAVATAASALPLQVCFYVGLVWAGSMLYQGGLLATGNHPQVNGIPQAGGVAEARRFVAADALKAGLAGSPDPRAAGWRTALQPRTDAAGAMSNSHTVASFRWIVYQYGVRGLMTSKGMETFRDGETLWTFSHDRMRFHGVNGRTRADEGWFGTGGAGTRSPFVTVPVAERDNAGGTWIVDAHDLYRIDEPGQRLQHVLHVDGQEQLGGRVGVVGGRMLVLTNRRLVVLTPATTAPPAAADVRLPLPYGDLESMSAGEVPDGTLVTFVFGHRQADGSSASQQVTYLVDQSARVQEVGRRALAHDFPALFEHRSWWVSPLLAALVKLPDLLVDDGTVPDYGASRFAPLLHEHPPVVWTAALAALLLSGAGAAWWTRRAGLGPRMRTAWCLACLLLGVPALLSLMVLQPRRGVATAAAPARMEAMKT
ncbi:hypothetical protein [Massilia rhizosphaerae]|uniref:hypothetical protein n=1 Tax=Massilia rhizosphaerae TaxID=2784389 RepID=UPI0018DDB94C|nr:hypothetical protein [Massilia rhizosphaerae]